MKSSEDRLIRLIAVFKFFKAGMLIALGVGAFKLLHKDASGVVEHWIQGLGLDPAKHFINIGLAKVSRLKPDQIKQLGLGSFLYAGLFLTEGTGLWLLKRWAEWLTVGITTSLVPIEIYEIYRHPSAVKFGVLLINIAIVAYLVYRIRSRKAGSK